MKSSVETFVVRAARLGTVILILSVVAGCATQETARHVAALSAESVNGLKGEMVKFVGEANNLRTANETRLQRLEQQTLALRVDAGQASSAWKVSKDQRAVEMYAAMTAVSADDLTKTSLSLDLLQPAPNPPKITFSGGQFDTLVQHLNELAAEPSLSDSLSALIEFGIKVDTQLNKDIKDAAGGLAKTQTQAANATGSLTRPKTDSSTNPN